MDVELLTFSSDESDHENNVQVKCTSADSKFANFTRKRPYDSKAVERYKAIITRKIDLIRENPFTENQAEIMEDPNNFQIIICVMENASKNPFVPSIDSKWLLEQFNLLNCGSDQKEDLYYCREDLLKLARSASHEAEANNCHNEILANRLRLLRMRIKVDEMEKDHSRPERTRIENNTWKRTSCELTQKNLFNYKHEPEEKTQQNNDEEPGRYLDDKYEPDDMFAPTPSPSPPPRTNMSDAVEIEENLTTNASKAGEKGIYNKQKQRRNAEITDRLPRYEGPTRLQQLKEQMGNHIFKPQKGGRMELEPFPSTSNVETNSNLTTSLKKDKNTFKAHSSRKQTTFQNHEYLSNKTNAQQRAIPPKLLNLKSCLKRSICNVIRNIRRIRFTDDTITPLPKDKNYTLPGQATKTFTRKVRVSASVANVHATLLKKVPNSDLPIQITGRDNPMQKSPGEINKIKREIYDDFQQVMSTSALKRMHRLLISDSLMNPLNTDIFKNMLCMNLNYPRMPDWMFFSLDLWFKTPSTYEKGAVFEFSKVFISLGMDLNIYYAHPEADQGRPIFEFLEKIDQWFDNKLARVKHDWELRGEQSSYVVSYMKPLENHSTQEIKWQRIKHKPEFIVITIPEIGDWIGFFRPFNNSLREFVKQHSEHFTLLDWADILRNKSDEEISSVEKRTAILIKEMHAEHGVLYH